MAMSPSSKIALGPDDDKGLLSTTALGAGQL
jgi:hypothetical protein